MDQFKAKFLNEAGDLLADLEKFVLLLEEHSQDHEQIEQVFRVMHTFKGNSTMFGFDRVGEFTHHLESIYDLIRAGKAVLTAEVLDVTLASVDHIRALLKDESLENDENKKRHGELIQQLSKAAGHPAAASVEETKQTIKSAPSSATYFISFQPKEGMLTTGGNPFYLIDELVGLGDSKVYCVSQDLPSAGELDPTKCYLSWNILLATEKEASEITEVFMFAEDDCHLAVEKISDEHLLHYPHFLSQVENTLSTQKQVAIGFLKDLALTVSLEAKKTKGQTQETNTKSNQTQKETNGASIRVPSEKLDDLLNLVSELVTTQARLSLFAENNNHTELLAIAENVEKISRQLRDNTFSICLVPIESITLRFKRLVRDLSAELGKDVNFVTEGSETELDKTIIDRLSDPLLHIIRNSMDHGIEETALREKRGKPKQARILLKAYYSGTNVHLEVHDDGGGIDPQKVKEKAIQKGLIAPDANLNEHQLLDLIFLPGFSTTTKVTEVSGRGVGMDVVKRNVEALKGEVSLHSEVGKGTQITIKLPLTLSIIDGLLVKIDTTHFVIPLSAIDKCYEALHLELVNNFNNLLILDGRQVPYFYLREEFDLNENIPAIEQVVVIKYGDVRVGLTVDAIVGEYQAVLKPLGKLYKNLDIISGATILGDGSIALVLDTNQIVRQFSTSQKQKEAIL